MDNDVAVRTRILVVDDSNLMRKAVQKMLGAEFDVVTAIDGLDAWAKLERDSTIQVVFSDLSMPRCDGYELLQKVRAAEDSGIQNIPLIVVTGAENDEAARKRALDLGATDFITKPFTATNLVARARAHAKYQRITRQLQEQSTLDPLTGLLNKSGFLVRLQQDISFARRHTQPLTLVCLEIDDFRKIFLQKGKPFAESLVAQISRQVRARIRTEDSAARVGLGGYALSFLVGQHDGIEAMIGQLRADVAAVDQEVAGRQIRVTLSAAVVTPLLHAETDAEVLLEQCQEVLKEVQASSTSMQEMAKAFAAMVPGPTDEPIAETRPAPKPEPKSPAIAVAAPAAPIEAAPVAPTTVDQAHVGIDAVLDQIESGDTHAVIGKLPRILNRLRPLFRMLPAAHRTRLIHFLQKLGPE